MPKDIAMLALGKMGPKEAPAVGDDGGDDDGLAMAMQDFLSALDAKDPQGMAAAFKSACEICG